MKNILALFALILVITSCSVEENETDSNTNPPNNDLRLVRMDVGYIDESTPYTIVEYVYDTDGRVDKVLANSSDGSGETVTSDYQYQDGRVVSIDYSNGLTRTYSYQGIRIVSSEFNGTTWTYEYDTFGRLEVITQTQGGGISCTTTYTYGGTSQPTESYNDCTQNTTMYTYDDKKNPQYYLFHDTFSKVAPLTPNNIAELTVTGPTDEPSYTTVMNYNDEGWPTFIQYISEGNPVSADRFYYQEP